MLQAIHGFWIKQMVFAFAAPLVFTAKFKLAVNTLIWSARMRNCVTRCNFCTHLLEANSINSRNRSRKELLNKRVTQTNGFKNLGTGI